MFEVFEVCTCGNVTFECIVSNPQKTTENHKQTNDKPQTETTKRKASNNKENKEKK